MSNTNGYFVVSLDFELMWGVRDEVTKESYGQHIIGVHTAIPKLLDCFNKNGIRATFASVGFLFIKDQSEQGLYFPKKLPNYTNDNLSPYGIYMDSCVGKNYSDDPYHYGWHLLQMIQESPGQEIATHTFSHYYCLEEGQTKDDFKNDLEAAIKIANSRNIKIGTIIFPRNQVNESYLDLCREAGLTCYRNNELSWIYRARSNKGESLLRRSIRLLDAYIMLSGHHCYTNSYMASSFPYNIPSSRFLRPYMKKLRWLEWLRLKRITKSMTYAAKNNLTYHLWWHPHNFGINQQENFAFLKKILNHYQYLHKKYGFASRNMSELSQILKDANGK